MKRSDNFIKPGIFPILSPIQVDGGTEAAFTCHNGAANGMTFKTLCGANKKGKVQVKISGSKKEAKMFNKCKWSVILRHNKWTISYSFLFVPEQILLIPLQICVQMSRWHSLIPFFGILVITIILIKRFRVDSRRKIWDTFFFWKLSETWVIFWKQFFSKKIVLKETSQTACLVTATIWTQEVSLDT